jgi:hypothetical protein
LKGYEGEFCKGLPEGKGKACIKTPFGKEFMEGNFLSGKLHGEGSYTFYNGDSYVGQFRGGRRHGRGVYHRLTRGEVFEGEFFENLPIGQGKLTKKGTMTIKGEFSGEGISEGVVKFTSGKEYRGWFKDSLAEGKGMLQMDNGDQYKGDWKAGEKHGKGILMLNGENAEIECLWEKDVPQLNYIRALMKPDQRFEGKLDHQLNREGITLFENKDIFRGEYKGKFLHGRGEYLYENGEMYIGSYDKGQKHGEGTFFYKNGDIFCGSWECGMKVKGTYYYSSGIIYVGTFLDNQREGLAELFDVKTEKVVKSVWKEDILEEVKGVEEVAEDERSSIHEDKDHLMSKFAKKRQELKNHKKRLEGKRVNQ